jgi:Carboxypeptidase regulatory-like domain/TonB-dependent Receptor Plug Domain
MSFKEPKAKARTSLFLANGSKVHTDSTVGGMTMPIRTFGEKFLFACSLFAILCIACLCASQARAQVAGAALSGTVADPSGAVVPNAKISVRNTATNVTRELTTDNAGFYTVPNLLPGTYEITVSASGFATEVRTGIGLDVGAEQVLNLALRVGASTERVEVTGEAPAIELVSSAITETVNSTTVRELPLNGRSWTDLAALQPGVDSVQTQPAFATGGDRGNRGFGAELTISGVRPQYNNYRLDGISLNDYSNGAPGSVLGGNLGVDAIQEFSVITSNYSAEYGKTAGGVVNAITRSGTNGFHGDAYEFLRNSALDAKNFFDTGAIPPFRRNQFGGSAGGPIRKGRTFIFGDFEAIRQAKGITDTNPVPSDAARGGTLQFTPVSAGGSGPPSGCTVVGATDTCTVTVDPSAAKYLALYPHANGAVTGNTGVFSFAGLQAISENFVTTRVDHKFSDMDSIYGTYMYDDTDYHDPDSFNNQLIGSHTKRQIVAIEENHVFSPRLINTVRVGYNREYAANNHSAAAINPAAADPTLGSNPGGNASDVRISGVGELLGGLNSLSTYFYHWNSIQAYDDASLTHGKHTLKFGFAVERIRLNLLGLSNPGGVWNFNNLAAFLTNNPSKYTSGFVNTLTTRGFRESVFGAYIQDDWRVRRNLTLNLGLRYEPTTVFSEVSGKTTNLINLTDATPHTGDPFFQNPTLRNFAPRVGFAWDPFGNGKTAVRGGFGLFDVLPLPYQFVIGDNAAAPFFKAGAISNGAIVNGVPVNLAGTFYTGGTPLLGATSAQGAYFQNNPKRDYVMQWNLNVQRELAPNLTATIGYVGSHGVHEPFRTEEFDNVTPQLTSAGYLVPLNTPTINPNFGTIKGSVYDSNSSYNALEVGIQKRMSHGLQAQGSFTWAKSLDDNSASVAGDQFSNSIAALWNWFNPSISKGLSDFNVARTLVINVTWDVPGVKSEFGPVKWIANGWELGGIFTASSGIPFTPTIGLSGDPLGLGGAHPADYPNRLTGSGCSTAVNPGSLNYIKTQCFAVPTAPDMAFYTANCKQVGKPENGLPFPECLNLAGNAGRNSLIGPGLTDLDFSLFKNNPIRKISETFNIQFRAELFNVLNHPNFLPPLSNTDIFDGSGNPLTSTAGVLNATTNDSREVQFALKFIW